MSHPDILPDSRLRRIHDPRGSVTGTVLGHRLQWEQCYCANCGVAGIMCPTENMTFMFWLCEACFEKHGAIAGTYAVPDDIFYSRLNAELLEQYGGIPGHKTLAAALADDESTIAKLAKDKPKAK